MSDEVCAMRAVVRGRVQGVGFRDYVEFNRALVDAAKTGMGKKTAEEIAAELKPKFPVFTKEELLTDMEYGGTPLSRAVINVNAAFQELAKR